MSGTNLLRMAGWAALLSGAATVGSFAVAAPPGGAPNPVYIALTIASSLLLLPVFYALFVLHRPEAGQLSLAMLVIGVAGVAAGVLDPTYQTALSLAANALFGLAYLLLGYMGSRSNYIPKGLAILSYVVGAISLMVTVLFVAAPQFAELVLVPAVILFLAWDVWLAHTFIVRKLATA